MRAESGWRFHLHRCHFRHGSIDEHEAHPADEEYPYISSCSAIDKANASKPVCFTGYFSKSYKESNQPFLELFYTYTSVHSQDATKIIEKAHIDTKRKFRYINVRISPKQAHWRGVYAP